MPPVCHSRCSSFTTSASASASSAGPTGPPIEQHSFQQDAWSTRPLCLLTSSAGGGIWGTLSAASMPDWAQMMRTTRRATQRLTITYRFPSTSHDISPPSRMLSGFASSNGPPPLLHPPASTKGPPHLEGNGGERVCEEVGWEKVEDQVDVLVPVFGLQTLSRELLTSATFPKHTEKARKMSAAMLKKGATRPTTRTATRPVFITKDSM